MTRVGYAGGKSESPSYRSVCGGDGHTEVLLVGWDPEKVTFREILDTFWNQVGYRVSCGGKPQYRTVIMTTNDAQARLVAEDVAAHGANVPTESLRGRFHLAEEYHQNYIAKQQRR